MKLWEKIKDSDVGKEISENPVLASIQELFEFAEVDDVLYYPEFLCKSLMGISRFWIQKNLHRIEKLVSESDAISFGGLASLTSLSEEK